MYILHLLHFTFMPKTEIALKYCFNHHNRFINAVFP
uniref:Uncharacterized protein n=1 Tax=Anguilla anguilla TaxID=7936 RepID=A0A0E9PLE3_ANGAN